MKDLSFFLLKNSLGSKMRKGIRNFCNGDGSTSTLNQHKPNNHVLLDDHDHDHDLMISSPYYKHRTSTATTTSATPPTLEEMILQLELEEEIARNAKLNHDLVTMRGRRMSCVNNSDILRSARNALNQYPRFSLDGKDAMYRSSFRNLEQVAGRKSVCCERGLVRHQEKYLDNNNSSYCTLPPTLAGESVVWCKPGVIAKLMGLDEMPMPINSCNRQRNSCNKETLSSIIKRQNLRRRVERHEMERRLVACSSDHMNNLCKRGRMGSSCSRARTGYCVMKPVAVEPPNDEGGWPTRRFR